MATTTVLPSLGTMATTTVPTTATTTEPRPHARPILRDMKAERLLAELNRLRQDVPKDPTDLEWFTVHHVFCFVSYNMAAFQKYLDEAVKPGEEPED
jgi:hypothetical protein